MSFPFSQNVVFFVGAGFTKAVAKTAPTGEELFLKAFTSPAYYDDPRIQSVKDFILNTYRTSSLTTLAPRIEDVLSLVDYTIQKQEPLSTRYSLQNVKKVRNDIIYLIGRVIKDGIETFSQRNLNISRQFIEKVNALRKKISETFTDSRVSIISTNYDIIIDNALLEKAVSCNYGIRLRFNVYPYITKTEDIRDTMPEYYPGWNFAGVNGLLNRGEIDLIKIHGSLNWFHCPKCDELDITVGGKELIELTKDQNEVFCVNKFCTSRYEPLLVTPTMLKAYDTRILKELWKLSEKRISESDLVIFIGYSLPEADYLIRSLLSDALAKREDTTRIIVIEKKPESEEEKLSIKKIEDRYRRLFGEIKFCPIGLQDLLINWDVILDINFGLKDCDL